ncbi:DUF4870 domain-containing protein [archaeon]|jgi:uncharacterized membrane protein|nr:DUF4870 domain-containing protein [archaeon]MBT3730883.1 DUF4870 domain-containing protein [archaeon]MBT4669878.1 DUF4870 domain-containing protein [archaeon]MBT5030030.1 DUF4870 domain-containing protein [archaeon]MBT5288131.1 DUF4870 domain-containing protein [archaeon]
MAKKKKNDDSKVWAFLGVFLTLIGFLIVYLTKKNDKYAMYYAKHGLVLFIGWVVFAVLGVIPLIGWIFGLVGNLLLLVAWVVAWIGALSGEEKKIPVITDLAMKFNF